jgi:two-component system, chemotaxis family, sensor kinase CheA
VTDRAEALRARLLATFRVEAQEHLQTIAAEIGTLTREPGAGAHLEDLLRAMHTLKGASRSVGFSEFEGACHRCETLISTLIREGATPTAADLRLLQDASMALGSVIAGTMPAGQLSTVAVEATLQQAQGDTGTLVDATAAAAVVHDEAAVPAAPAALAADTIRVEVGRLDNVVTLAESLLHPKLASNEHVRLARGVVEDIERVRARAGLELREELHSLEMRARQLLTVLRQDSRLLTTAVDELNDEMRRVRMMPAASILDAFPLMVHDLCRETGKEVDWSVVGANLEVDRKVLELVKDPLIHMVRNAIDHGVEAPGVREAAGKPRRGSLVVTVAPSEGGRISIEVADDGKGFALDALRDAAIRSRLASEEQLAALSDAEVADLAYSAGVSTSPVITTISGHGRGLAIVRERIERVEGRISTRSTPGQGTVIRLEFPASIVTYRALLIAVHGRRFLLPLDSVEHVFAVQQNEVTAGLARGTLTHAERDFPFGSLGPMLGLPRIAEDELAYGHVRSCLLLRSGERRGILLVDDVLGEQEVVIKELHAPLLRVRNVLTTALLGTGELVLVLRSLDLIASITVRPLARPQAAIAAMPRVLRLLVVDDSTTTRTMERNMFEAAGYTVQVAADGAAAWEIVQTEELDVVVSDVDMPRMNGFELTSRIRSEPRLAKLPVVLVSALEAREDKEQGIRVGANAYVLKSGFNQANLLDIVRRLA